MVEQRMEYNLTTEEYTCPVCGSKHIRVKSGMTADLYICEDCGLESRYVTYI